MGIAQTMCVCSLSYPECNAHAPNCQLWPAPFYNIFSHYLINGAIFGKKITEYQMCVLFLSTPFETFIILRRNERDVIKIYIGFHVKYPFILFRFQWNLNFINRFSKNPLISNFKKIRPVGAELFHAYGRTEGTPDTMKLIVAFRNFAKGLKTACLTQIYLCLQNCTEVKRVLFNIKIPISHAINKFLLIKVIYCRIKNVICLPSNTSLTLLHTSPKRNNDILEDFLKISSNF